MSELFYEECLDDRPIVDLCLYHAAKNLFNRVERILHTHYGIQVDRDIVQRYAELFAERVENRHSVTVADEPLSRQIRDVEMVVVGVLVAELLNRSTKTIISCDLTVEATRGKV